MSVEDTQPLITHLIELRKRLLNCIISVIVIFLCLVYFANDIYHLVSAPLIKQLPQGSTMIATDVASPFFYADQADLYGVADSVSAGDSLSGVGVYRPALYKHERRLVVPLLVSSSLLFYIGMAFAYFVVFPLAFGFLANTAPEGVQVSTDIASYLASLWRCLWRLVSPLKCRWQLCCCAGWGLPRQKTYAKNARMCWLVHSLSGCC